MHEATKYLNDVSLFGASASALVIILVVNLVLTLAHSFQELKGRLWRYFGAIAGIRMFVFTARATDRIPVLPQHDIM